MKTLVFIVGALVFGASLVALSVAVYSGVGFQLLMAWERYMSLTGKIISALLVVGMFAFLVKYCQVRGWFWSGKVDVNHDLTKLGLE